MSMIGAECLPALWSPRLVRARVWQLYRVVTRALYRQRHLRDHDRHPRDRATPPVQGWLDELGIGVTMVPGVRKRDHHLAWTRCPQCRHQARRLFEYAGTWVCETCESWPLSYHEIMAAEYLCGVRIGLRGAVMRKRRARLAARVSLYGQGAHALEDVVGLTVASSVLVVSPTWNRRGARDLGLRIPERGRVGLGPVWRACVPHFMPALIDTLLHRDAYLGRFGAAVGRRVHSAARHGAAINERRERHHGRDDRQCDRRAAKAA